MKDRLTVIGLYHNNDTMSFAVVLDTAGDDSGGQLRMTLCRGLFGLIVPLFYSQALKKA